MMGWIIFPTQWWQTVISAQIEYQVGQITLLLSLLWRGERITLSCKYSLLVHIVTRFSNIFFPFTRTFGPLCYTWLFFNRNNCEFSELSGCIHQCKYSYCAFALIICSTISLTTQSLLAYTAYMFANISANKTPKILLNTQLVKNLVGNVPFKCCTYCDIVAGCGIQLFLVLFHISYYYFLWRGGGDVRLQRWGVCFWPFLLGHISGGGGGNKSSSI